jgi:hypothetical protein
MDQIKKLIESLKEVLEAGKKLKEQQDQEAAAKQAQQDKNAGIEQVPEAAMSMFYLAADADNAGNMIARAEATDNESEIKAASKRLEEGQRIAQMWAITNGGEIVQQGGDEFCLKMPSSVMDRVELLRQEYLEAVGNTLTVGIGAKISESIKARMLGKVQGKDRIVIFDESTEKELKLRLEQKGEQTEEQKVSEAMGKSEESTLQKSTPKWAAPKK